MAQTKTRMLTLLLTSGGVTVPYSHADTAQGDASMRDLAQRFQSAKVATPTIVEEYVPFTLGDEAILLGVALAKAEGRDIGVPHRCDTVGCYNRGYLTFGGCCA